MKYTKKIHTNTRQWNRDYLERKNNTTNLYEFNYVQSSFKKLLSKSIISQINT